MAGRAGFHVALGALGAGNVYNTASAGVDYASWKAAHLAYGTDMTLRREKSITMPKTWDQVHKACAIIEGYKVGNLGQTAMNRVSRKAGEFAAENPEVAAAAAKATAKAVQAGGEIVHAVADFVAAAGGGGGMGGTLEKATSFLEKAKAMATSKAAQTARAVASGATALTEKATGKAAERHEVEQAFAQYQALSERRRELSAQIKAARGGEGEEALLAQREGLKIQQGISRQEASELSEDFYEKYGELIGYAAVKRGGGKKTRKHKKVRGRKSRGTRKS
jgi:hypothetical protein